MYSKNELQQNDQNPKHLLMLQMLYNARLVTLIKFNGSVYWEFGINVLLTHIEECTSRCKTYGRLPVYKTVAISNSSSNFLLVYKKLHTYNKKIH